MYTVIEIALVGLIVLFSAYHVLNLLLPKAMLRVRVAAGRRLGRTKRMRTFATRLQSPESSGGCGSCNTNAGCRGCAVGSRGEQSLIDGTEKSVT